MIIEVGVTSVVTLDSIKSGVPGVHVYIPPQNPYSSPTVEMTSPYGCKKGKGSLFGRKGQF